ncbi:DMT family transporter [Croceitalea rosinachiae]|uniref:EamA family transporter n=1 Tax=Croceitalea rosinachiae TaxID=3075596 RepID=A0ABU3A9F1_9FLAO|nr:EamA family transporter [Croceitalea sp. F388]MDT0606584.1 EamA family transporter [Croceitalea sp. F388]
MNEQNRKWIYLFVLSIIWGTSYILIKKGLEGFTPIQLGSARIIIAGFFLFLIGFKSLRLITKEEWKWVAISGFIGSFFPMFLFAYAETEIDSSIAAILNSLVPLFTLFVGLFAFGVSFTKNQLIGVLVGLLGAGFLIFFGKGVNPNHNYWYAGFVIVATICYACNANIIKSKLQNVTPMGIAVGNFASIIVPALVVLPFSGFFSTEVTSGDFFWSSLGYIVVLCVIGTCIAKVMFNRLVQISSAVFSVSVTYLIPIVGIFWGVLDEEKFTIQQLLASLLILLGVYLVNKKVKLKAS